MKRRRDMKFPENGFEQFGGYMQAKIAKLEGQYALRSKTKDGKLSNIFAGISIFVNGFTRPSADELKIIMSQHGGIYHHYHRKEIDYIIASNLPDTKVKRLTSQKIVKPEWITDSLSAGKLLNYEDYLLYTKRSRLQPRLSFETGQKTKHDTLCKEEVFDASPTSNALRYSFKGLELENKSENPLYEPLNNVNGELIIEDNKNNELKDEVVIKQEHVTPTKVAKIVRVTLQKIDNSMFDKPESMNKCQKLINEQLKNKVHSSAVLDKIFHETTSESKATRTAVDPNFLGEFYNNSRLHHISQLGAGFKQYVNDMRDSREEVFPLRNHLKEEIIMFSKESNFEDNSTVPCQNEKVIMHIDMDCFFVSVGLRNKPELRGHPVAVTHAKNSTHKPQSRLGVNMKTEFNMYKQRKMNNLLRSKGDFKSCNLPPSRTDDISDDENSDFGSMSEIASCSYEARALGLKNGMFMGAALKLCPNLKTIPYDFEEYKLVAFTLYNTIAQYTLDIEAVSCDEMYVDCTSLLKGLNITPMQFAKALRKEIMQKTGCPCSTGFGSNRLQARLATKKAKPNGQYYLRSDFVDCFMSEIPLSDLPGVGRQMQCKLSALGFTTCGTLISANLSFLQRHFGNKTGLHLYHSCRGIDDKPLSFTTVRKSVSAEVNYGIRFQDYQQCEIFIKQLCVEVHNRLINFKVIGKAITFKLMVRAADAPVETAKFMGHGFCDNLAKTVTLKKATNDLNIITREILDIVKKLQVKPEEMRGIGIQMSKLESVTNKSTKRGALQTFLNIKSKNVLEKINETAIEKPFKQNLDLEVQQSAAVELELTNTPKKSQSSEIIQKVANTNALKLLMSPLKDKLPVSPIKISKLPKCNVAVSPSRKRHLGMTARRRGRPPKNKNLEGKSTKDNFTGAMSMFLQKNNNENSCQDNMNLSGIDNEFLDALPEDLKNEVIKEHRQNKLKQNREVKIKSEINDAKLKTLQYRDSLNENIKIDDEFLAALPQELRTEIEAEFRLKHNNTKKSIDTPKIKNYSEPTNPSKSNEDSNIHGLFNMHWRKIREMMRAWLQCEKTPMTCDVDIMSIYMQNMVINKEIEDLSCLLRFLHRNVNSPSKCEWHEVYNQIAGSVQESMAEVYEGQLLIPHLFTCCHSKKI